MEPKKRSLGATERDEFLRAAWRVLVAGGIDAGRFVFVDECGTNTSLSPLYAWSRKGERARAARRRATEGPTSPCLRAWAFRGWGRAWLWRGATTSAVFEAYLEDALAPSLRPGQEVVVMDNLSAHKGERVRRLIEESGCELLYLPAYSPDLNPIEQAFSKLKTSLRRAGARTFGALVEAMGQALEAITARDASGFFRHCGYRSSVQLP